MKSEGKRAQINLSFGMLFSIILIIVFISFAFYAISKFLDIQKAAKTGQFIFALESDVSQMWKSSQGSQTLEYSLPTSIGYVCFADFASAANPSSSEGIYDDLRLVHFTDENMFFYPVGSAGAIDGKKISNVNVFEITSRENPYCITNTDGKIKLTLKKALDGALVTVTK